MLRRGTVEPIREMKSQRLSYDEWRDSWRHWSLTQKERTELTRDIRILRANLEGHALSLPQTRKRCELISAFAESFEAEDVSFPGGSLFFPVDVVPEIIEAIDGKSPRLDLLFEFFARAAALGELREPSVDHRRRTAVLKLLPVRHPVVNMAQLVGGILTEWPLSDPDPRADIARSFLRFQGTARSPDRRRSGAAEVSPADHLVGSIAEEMTGEVFRELVPELYTVGVRICRCLRIFMPASDQQEYCSERCMRRLKQRERRANSAR